MFKRVNGNMTNAEKQEFHRLLILFLEKSRFLDKDYINKNKSALLIKNTLSKLGRWKQLPRGDVKPKNENQMQILRRHQLQTRSKKTKRNDCPF